MQHRVLRYVPFAGLRDRRDDSQRASEFGEEGGGGDDAEDEILFGGAPVEGVVGVIAWLRYPVVLCQD